MTHVPYRGSAPLVIDLLSGQVEAAFDNLQSSVVYLKQRKLRALAVTTATRSPSGEFLPGCEADAWIRNWCPEGRPGGGHRQAQQGNQCDLTDPKIAARIADLGCTPFFASPAELDKLVIEYTEKWGELIRAAHVKLE